MRPVSPPAWTSLAASSSMCTRLMRQRSFSSPAQYSNQPSTASGSSNCEIWYAFGRSG